MKSTLHQKADPSQVSVVHSANTSATGAAGLNVATPKDRIFALAQDKNLSESLGAVLHAVALLDSGKPSIPNSEDERLSWDGYRRGLISALLCVAMHEQQCAPKDAALLVHSLLDQAGAILRTARPENEA